MEQVGEATARTFMRGCMLPNIKTAAQRENLQVMSTWLCPFLIYRAMLLPPITTGVSRSACLVLKVFPFLHFQRPHLWAVCTGNTFQLKDEVSLPTRHTVTVCEEFAGFWKAVSFEKNQYLYLNSTKYSWEFREREAAVSKTSWKTAVPSVIRVEFGLTEQETNSTSATLWLLHPHFAI